ncbi:hypothetical protein FGB62_35g17 [Gracilaria domingensis]|nr:hypothetical protein FGB62_35g17 [Gracilaria domingensis]
MGTGSGLERPRIISANSASEKLVGAWAGIGYASGAVPRGLNRETVDYTLLLMVGHRSDRLIVQVRRKPPGRPYDWYHSRDDNSLRTEGRSKQNRSGTG